MTVFRSAVLLALAFSVTLPESPAFAKKIDGDRLLDPDRLLNIRIELPEADWNRLRVQGRNPGAFFGGGTIEEDPYDYFKADLWIDDVKIESVAIRKKGLFGSQDNDRPSLKVSFDEFVDQDPIKGLSRLTLNNNKQDQSQLSQFLTYRLFREAGIHAPRSNLARVTVNGRYLGIYSNVESIKKPFLSRSFGDKSGNLYEGTLTDFHPKTVDRLEVKTNEDTNDRGDIRRLAELLAEDGELDLERLGRIIDLDHFLRFWALEGMTRFWDGYASNQNNFYLYFNPKNGLGYFIPWGADWVLSRGGPFSGAVPGTTAVYAQSILTNRLYKTRGIPERYRRTVLQLLDEVWDEAELIAEIDRLEKLISPHLHDSQQNTPQAMNELRGFIRSRRGELTSELRNWPAPVPPEPRKPMYTVAVGELAGTFATTFSQSAPADGSSVGETDMTLKLDGEVVELERLGVSVWTFQFPGFGGPRPGGPPGGFTPPVSLNFTGIRKSDQERITLSLMVDKAAFEKREGAIDVSGRLTIGQSQGPGFGFGFGGGRSINGTLRLTKSGTTTGDEVAGSVDLKIVETHGGFFNQRPPQGGPGQRPSGPGSGRPVARAELLPLLDQDQDGELSTEEIQRAPATLRRLDRNRDGALTLDELNSPPPPRSTPSGSAEAGRFSTQDDHRQMMSQLGITKLRPGPSGNASAENAANYDEAKANPFPDWPPVLKLSSGEEVTSPQAWREQRRPELVQLFESEVYGRIPEGVPAVTWSVKETRDGMAGEIPVIEQHLIGTVDNSAWPQIRVEISMSLTLPKETQGPVPVLMMFGRTPFDPMPEWMRRFNRGGSDQGGPRPPSRTDELVAAGWGCVMINPSSIQADNGAGLTQGIIGLTNHGQPRKPDDWGSLRAWGWGASRGLDYLQTRSEVHPKRVGIEGVSRYGKAALVTMAFDERFGMVLVGSSGAGGATPHRRNFGEAVENLAGSGEYHWMAGNFLKYAAEESSFGSRNAGDLPVDSHQLIALCAPRLTFISYGIPEKGDANWLDQRGSFMATVAAGKVFELLGANGLGITQDFRTATMPEVNHGLLDGSLAWRQHDGGHTDGPNMAHFIRWSEAHFTDETE